MDDFLRWILYGPYVLSAGADIDLAAAEKEAQRDAPQSPSHLKVLYSNALVCT